MVGRISEDFLFANGILYQGFFTKLLVLRNGLSIGSALPIVLPNSNFDVHYFDNGLQIKEKGKYLIIQVFKITL